MQLSVLRVLRGDLAADHIAQQNAREREKPRARTGMVQTIPIIDDTQHFYRRFYW